MTYRNMHNRQALSSEGELIMDARWNALHPDIQKRFEKNPAPGRPLRYKGVTR